MCRPFLERRVCPTAPAVTRFFYHRYHIVWITKYRYKVLQGKLRERVRDIIRQVCRELGVQIIEGVLSSDHIHMAGYTTNTSESEFSVHTGMHDDKAVDHRAYPLTL